MGAVLNDRHNESFKDAGPYMLGAMLAALVLPALVLGLAAPLWLGVAFALAVLIGTILAARVQHRRGAPSASPMYSALADAVPALERLHLAARAIGAFGVRVRVGRIADAGRLMVDRVSAEPAALATVQRVLTYYLPRAAAIAESYRVLEARDGEAPRLARIALLIGRLDAAFQHYAARLADDALRLLDVELRLVNEALDDDMGDAT